MDWLPDGVEDSPEGLLNALRTHPEWDEDRRAEVLEELVARFSPERLRQAIRLRFVDLRGHVGEAVVQLAEAFGTPDLLEALAAGLLAQPRLAPERAWEALSLLEGAGLLDSWPELAERFAELGETLDEGETSIEELARQLEDDPESAWIAVQGLDAIEPDIRTEILEGLARLPAGPGLIEFWRLVRETDRPLLPTPWNAPPPPPPCEGGEPEADSENMLVILPGLSRPGRLLAGSLITSLDSLGRGYVAIAASGEEGPAAAAFRCDVVHGVLDAIGRSSSGVLAETAPHASLAELADVQECDLVRDEHDAALALLGGTLVLNGTQIPTAVREWLDRTIGPEFQPKPLVTASPVGDLAAVPPKELADWSRAVLDCCTGWRDDSELTYDLAEELLLQGAAPDPERDSGAYRFLFENRLLGRLELDRRMLFWMAVFWRALGDEGLAHAALTLGCHLSEAPHAAPGHPFLVELATRSLVAAQANLRAGRDPRNLAKRAAASSANRP
jgi:hypothetical protein